MSLRDLYQDIIIDHSREPRNFGELLNANYCQCGHNPLCGDQLTLTMRMHNNTIEDARFSGNGCAISVASASLMTEAIKGKTRQEVEQLFAAFHHLLTTGEASAAEEDCLGKLLALAGVAAFPVRVKCATLAWHTLQAALANQIPGQYCQDPVSTE